MRSPAPPPGNYLGDDPDLTADLGQRLASTAQTAQGLITNYLFYGQRRAADQDTTLAGRLDATAEREHDTREALTVTPMRAQTARREVHPTPEPEPDHEATTEQQAQTARLAFRIVTPSQATAGSPLPGADDPLAVDGLAHDPNRVDPLAGSAAPSASNGLTLDPDSPDRGR